MFDEECEYEYCGSVLRVEDNFTTHWDIGGVYTAPDRVSLKYGWMIHVNRRLVLSTSVGLTRLDGMSWLVPCGTTTHRVDASIEV